MTASDEPGELKVTGDNLADARAATDELNLIAWALRAEHHRLSARALRAIDILRAALT